MHCEFCNVNLHDVAAARKHMLTIAHIRNKNIHDLNKMKYVDKRREAAIHPKNIEELAAFLNMHSDKDVDALYEFEFFKMNNQWHFNVAEEFIHVLQESGLEYHLNRLHPDVRLALQTAIDNEQSGSNDATQ